MKEKVKLALRKAGKVIFGLACTIIGLSMAGFGITQFLPEMPKKKKGGCKK